MPQRSTKIIGPNRPQKKILRLVQVSNSIRKFSPGASSISPRLRAAFPTQSRVDVS